MPAAFLWYKTDKEINRFALPKMQLTLLSQLIHSKAISLGIVSTLSNKRKTTQIPLNINMGFLLANILINHTINNEIFLTLFVTKYRSRYTTSKGIFLCLVKFKTHMQKVNLMGTFQSSPVAMWEACLCLNCYSFQHYCVVSSDLYSER